MGVYTPVTWVSDVWLSEAFVARAFVKSFLLTDLLLASILMSLFPFTSLFLQILLRLSWLVWILYFIVDG